MDQSEIIELITKTINSLFTTIFSSIDNNIYSNLDNITFIDSKIINNNTFQNLLGNNSKTGFLLITDSLLIAFFIFYIIKYYYSNFVDTHTEKPIQFIFKFIIFGILINSSYFLITQILDLNNLLSTSISQIGENSIGSPINFAELIKSLNKKLYTSYDDFNIFSFEGLIKSFISTGLLNLLFVYSLRFILIKVFVLITPFCLLTLISNSSSWIFKSWFKCFFSLLIIQDFIPIILIVIFSIDDSNKILYIGGIYVLTKINTYIREIFGGVGLEFNNQMLNLKSFISR